jgi:uncharacterized protein (TIGR02996 family)
MFHTSDDFLRAIEAEPGDRTRRLVFADWLDERADPRGELIRVEEEMRTLPVFSDRFWELKPRRNELRAAAGPEWCGRMRYGTEREPVFRHGVPDGWRDRWRLIREFTERWHRVPMADVGGREKEIAEAEARLGRTLPPSVREWIAFAHDARGVFGIEAQSANCVRDWAGSPGLYLGFHPDAEGYWAVAPEDLARPDSPVRYCGYRHDEARGDGEWVLAPASSGTQPVTLWAFDMLIPEVAVRPESVSFSVRNAARLLPELERHLWPRVRVGSSSVIETDNVLIEIRTAGDGTTLWVTCPRRLRDDEIPAVLRQMLRPENEALPF